MRMKLCILVRTHWEAVMGGSQYQAKVLIDYLLAHYDVDIAYLTARAAPNFTPQGYRIVRFSDFEGLRRYGAFFDAHPELPLLVVDIDRFDPLRKPADLQYLLERIAAFEGPRESLLTPPTIAG